MPWGRGVKPVVAKDCGRGVKHSSLSARFRLQVLFQSCNQCLDFEKETPMAPQSIRSMGKGNIFLRIAIFRQNPKKIDSLCIILGAFYA